MLTHRADTNWDTEVSQDQRDVVLHVLAVSPAQSEAYLHGLVTLTEACDKRGMACWFVCSCEAAMSQFGAAVEAAGGRVLVFEQERKGSTSSFRAFYSLFREVAPLAIHMHPDVPSVSVALAARLAGVPRIVTTLQAESPTVRGNEAGRRLRLRGWLVDEVVCDSTSAEQVALSVGVSAAKVRLLPLADAAGSDRAVDPAISRSSESASMAAATELAELYELQDVYVDAAPRELSEDVAALAAVELEAGAVPAAETAVAAELNAADHVDDLVRDKTSDALSRGAVLFGAKGATFILALIINVALPRFLGPAAFGRLYFAMSFTGIFAILVEFGLNALVVREVSRKREDASRYLVNAAMLKGALWIVAFALMFAVVNLANYPAETRAAVLILAVAMLMASMSSLLVAVLQAEDRVRWISISSVVEKVVYVGLGVTALLLGYSIIAVAVAFLLGAFVGLVLDLYWLRSLSKRVSLHEGWQGLEVGPLLRRALPFFSYTLFAAAYFRIDVVMLSMMKGDTVVGQYGAAYKLFETTNFIPEAFLFALLPIIARLAMRRDRALAKMAQKALDILLLIAFPLAVGTFVLARNIITTLYGQGGFGQSVIVLRILAIAIVLMFANGVSVRLLIVTERQKRLSVTAVVAAITNLSLNLLLIPRLGAVGAAATTVFTEGVVMTMNASFLPRGLIRQIQPVVPVKSFLAAAIMAVPLVALREQNLVLLVFIGIAVYALAVRVLRILPSDDWNMMKTALMRLRAA